MDFYVINKHHGRVRAQVSENDADLVLLRWSLAGGKGSVGKYLRHPRLGYLHRVVAHRMGLIGAVAGEGRSGLSVDHINGDKLDNRRENLRTLTRSQQMSNANDGPRSSNTSGHVGVVWDASRGKWSARVMRNYRHVWSKRFDTIEEAVTARAEWLRENEREPT